jgi:hypothetical protein
MEIFMKKSTWNYNLVTSGFQIFNVNFSLYVKKMDHEIVAIVIYVDDLIATGNNDVNIFDFKNF